VGAAFLWVSLIYLQLTPSPVEGRPRETLAATDEPPNAPWHGAPGRFGPFRP
jgi:hypothetical protein